MNGPVDVLPGDAPLVLAVPHAGQWLPDAVRRRLNPLGRTLADADWHVDRLYRDLLPGATLVRARFHRYLIDANRDPGGASLYPGQNTTGLVPLTDFDGEPIWRDGEAPGDDEVDERRERYHAAYHRALAEQLDRVRSRHGAVLLYDCHSIRSRIPFLFDGRLPDLNLGSNDGRSCAPLLERHAIEACRSWPDYSAVLNGRFKGGWTTRHYGAPARGRHALQMELAQCCYLRDERPPFAYDAGKADRLRARLKQLLGGLQRLLLENIEHLRGEA